MVVVVLALGFSTRPKASPAPGGRTAPSHLLHPRLSGHPKLTGTFSACQSNCNEGVPGDKRRRRGVLDGQSCDVFCYDPTSCRGSALVSDGYADGYDPEACDSSETGTFSDCDSDDVPCGPFNLDVDYKPYGEAPCPAYTTIPAYNSADGTCGPTTLLRVSCSSNDCQGTPPFYDDGACLGPNKGCDGSSDDEACTPTDCDSDDLSCQDSLCIQKDDSKDNDGSTSSARGAATTPTATATATSSARAATAAAATRRA